MVTYALVLLTCWFCALLATPRKPRLGNEVEELVYTRLLGRQHLLVFFAAIITAASVVVLIVTLPQQNDPTLGESRRVNQYCAAASANLPFCCKLAANGTWMKAARQSDGQWIVVGTERAPSMQSVPLPGDRP